jgi:extradiol dioxygenase family protein
MAYDLVVEGDRWNRLQDDFSASADARECELRTSTTSLVVGLPRAEDAVRRAYGELVALSRAHGCRLFDPQWGAPVDLEAPGELPPGFGSHPVVPAAPTRAAAIGVRLYVHHLGLAKASYCDRFGATLVRETPDHLEVALCGVRFLLRLKRRRPTTDLLGQAPDQVPALSTVLTLEADDYARFALRMRRTGTPPFEFVFPPARREVPGEEPAECFVVRDCSDNYLEVRRAPAYSE